MLRLVLFIGLALFAAGPAVADSACDKPRNDFDGLYCLNKVYQQADHDLNTAFSKLREKLDAPGKAALKTGQLAWLQSRIERCSKREGTNFFVNLGCATQMTTSRTEFLESRYRECVSSGCMNSRL